MIDKEKEISGTLRIASIPDFKKRLEKLIKWYEIELKKLNIELKLGVELTPDLVNEIKPDIVIIATGSKPIIPRIPGIENAVIANDVLIGKVSVGNKVIVVGGGLVGCETALHLAKQGKDVTIIEALPDIALGEPFINRLAIMKLLKKYNVKLLTRNPVVEIKRER